MHAISSMATRTILGQIALAAELAGHPALQLESVGGVVAAKRVAADEAVDLVFLEQGALQRLAEQQKVMQVVPLMVSHMAAAVPAADGERVAPFADAAGMQAALLAAKRIGYSTGPSGVALLAMIEQWGLTEALADSMVQSPAGVPVAQLLASGEVDLGFQQLSELHGVAGVHILGVLPTECAVDTVFAGAVASTAEDSEAAGKLLDFFGSDAVAELIREQRFSPVTEI